MSSPERFAYAVSRIEELAPPVAAALHARLLPDEAPRQIIFAPRQRLLSSRRGLGAWFVVRWTPSCVLVRTDERLLVATIAEASKAPEVTATPLTDLLWVELGTILLYSWVAWSWVDAGQAQQQRVYFNSVCENLFWDMVNAMRRTIIAQSGLPLPTGDRHYAAFEGLPFKFMNLIPLRLLLPGEQAQVVVHQPPIWGRRLGVFGYPRAPTTVIVLSQEHLLVAQDDLTNLRTPYGIIARYCPRNRLRRVEIEQMQHDQWLNVTAGLCDTEETLRLLLAPDTEPALPTLFAQLQASSRDESLRA